MKINILTLFPEAFEGVLNNSIIKRACAKKLVSINLINIRDFTNDKNHRVDSAPISGGAGLILKCQPIVEALKTVNQKSYKILTSARGTIYNENKAKELSKLSELTIICGHYEGVDERVNDYVDELISVGDYILTGGEIPSMIILDSVIRLIDGVISSDSLLSESFDKNLLEYPQYTEPYNFHGKKVPEILYCGNHKVIENYLYKMQLKITSKYRPDLFKKLKLTKKDFELLNEEGYSEKEKEAIKKGKKYLPKN